MTAAVPLSAAGIVSTALGVWLATVAGTPPEPLSGAVLLISALGFAAILFTGAGVYLFVTAVAVAFHPSLRGASE